MLNEIFFAGEIGVALQKRLKKDKLEEREPYYIAIFLLLLFKLFCCIGKSAIRYYCHCVAKKLLIERISGRPKPAMILVSELVVPVLVSLEKLNLAKVWGYICRKMDDFQKFFAKL